MYDLEAVKPLWIELATVGVRPLYTPDEVDAALQCARTGTMMLVINSVCGCAATSCRPGVAKALQHDLIPDDSVTVFAGVDIETTDRARAYLPGIAPSSPCVALFKDGALIACLERDHIERMTAEQVAEALTDLFDQHCTTQGPSVPHVVYDRNEIEPRCGSTIPVSKGG
ncbi:MAG: BrxA/BrxB family bacilliredoxin [bacterium]|nr:BrxA/BrxB family bacilliredoxin [bacterium]